MGWTGLREAGDEGLEKGYEGHGKRGGRKDMRGMGKEVGERR